jgi:transaldolase
LPLVQRLSKEGFSLNVTAMLTLKQVEGVAAAVSGTARTIVSVFAGRIADTGINPVPMMTEAVKILSRLPRAELLWVSPREVLNVRQADECGCHIITATPDILAKLALFGKPLETYSLETVAMFHSDARAAGYQIAWDPRGRSGSADLAHHPGLQGGAQYSALPRADGAGARAPRSASSASTRSSIAS